MIDKYDIRYDPLRKRLKQQAEIIERLTAELAAAKGLLGECLESLYGVPISKRVRGDSRLGDAVERFLGEKL